MDNEPIRMKAAVLRAPGEGLRVEDVELDPPRSGEVLVRVLAAGVCHSDYHYMSGALTCPLPAVLGHEGTGVVEATGPGVTSVTPGDRVCLMWRPRCGTCSYCLAGRTALCEAGKGQAATGGLLDGTSRLSTGGQAVRHFLGVSCLAEYCVVSEKSVTPVPAWVPEKIAAILGCAVVTGAGAVLNLVRGGSGRSVAVFGAGGVGLSAVMAAAVIGAYPVIAVDVRAPSLVLAASLGATSVVDASHADPVAEIMRLTSGGAHWSVDAVGRPGTLRQAVDALRPGGTALAIGLGAIGDTADLRLNELVQRGKTVVGSLYGSGNLQLDLPRLVGLYQVGRLPLETLIGCCYPLAEIQGAYDALATGAAGRAVILPGGVVTADRSNGS
jgi:Zn-dependent alcohol dehydrogenase